MRLTTMLSLIQTRFARRSRPSRWSVCRHGSWSQSVALESLENRCLLSAGDLDTSFDGNGELPTAFSVAGMALQGDGKIIVAGSSNGDFILARYNANASLDTSFDGDGKLTTDFGSAFDGATSVVVQTDGKIVAAGGNVLARYNSNGTLDASFDGDGKLTSHAATSVVVQADGKIVAVGSNVLARYNSDGTMDTSFDGDGELTFEAAYRVVVQNDGKIVVAGGNVLARYNSDGTLDSSFDGDGKLTTEFGVASVAVQVDGKIIVAGTVSITNIGDFALACYNSDGTLDSSFEGDGRVTTGFGSLDSVTSVVVQADGKIVAAGNKGSGSNGDLALARYKSNGLLDVLFDGDGKLTTNFGSSDSVAAVAVQADGKIVVAGGFGLARYIGNTSPTMTTVNTAGIPENTLVVLTVTANDPDNQTLNYALNSGADRASFAINSASGVLSFLAAPNFEQPTDTDHNNVYLLTIQVSDGIDVRTQSLEVTVVNVDDPPTITSAVTASVTENSTTVLIVSAADEEAIC